MSSTSQIYQMDEHFPVELVRPVTRFLDSLRQQKNYSVLTQKNYQRQLTKLLEFMKSVAVTEWKRVKPVHIRQFSAFNHRQGLSPKSIALMLSASRSFFEFLIAEDIIHSNPARGIKPPKAAKKLPKTIEVDQLMALLDGIDEGEDIGIRDKAIAELFYSSGLRLAELTRLAIDEIDLNGQDRTYYW